MKVDVRKEAPSRAILEVELPPESVSQGMDRALAQYVILGLATNIAFLRDVLAHPVFQRGEATTAFIEREMPEWKARLDGEASDLALIAAALSEIMQKDEGGRMKDQASLRTDATRYDPWQADDGFRIGG